MNLYLGEVKTSSPKQELSIHSGESMEIEPIALKDLDSLSDLFVSVFNSPPWNESWEKLWALERLTILYNSYKFYGFLALENDAVVGAVFSRLGSFMGELELEITEMFVSESHQRKGIGGTLIVKLQERATSNNISTLVLQTDKSTYAKDFYLSHGFRSHEKNLLMSKNIDG